jgi:hypothetical protein
MGSVLCHGIEFRIVRFCLGSFFLGSGQLSVHAFRHCTGYLPCEMQFAFLAWCSMTSIVDNQKGRFAIVIPEKIC